MVLFAHRHLFSYAPIIPKCLCFVNKIFGLCSGIYLRIEFSVYVRVDFFRVFTFHAAHRKNVPVKRLYIRFLLLTPSRNV